jgi:hypothetical protein
MLTKITFAVPKTKKVHFLLADNRKSTNFAPVKQTGAAPAAQQQTRWLTTTHSFFTFTFTTLPPHRSEADDCTCKQNDTQQTK